MYDICMVFHEHLLAEACGEKFRADAVDWIAIWSRVLTGFFLHEGLHAGRTDWVGQDGSGAMLFWNVGYQVEAPVAECWGFADPVQVGVDMIRGARQALTMVAWEFLVFSAEATVGHVGVSMDRSLEAVVEVGSAKPIDRGEELALYSGLV